MLEANNKALVRTMLEACWNRGELGSLDDLLAPTYVNHDPALPAPARGVEPYRQVVRMYRTAFPDVRLTIEDMIGEGDVVSTRWSVTGTHQGVLLGVKATGKRIALTGVTMTRLQAGKIQEDWVAWDLAGLMRQLGGSWIVPTAASSGRLAKAS